MFTSFKNSLIATIIANIYKKSSQGFNIRSHGMIISLGIIWSSLKHLIVIGGITILFSAGLRGSGLKAEYLFFNLVFWFLFIELINPTVKLKFNKAFLSQINMNVYIYYLGNIFATLINFFFLLNVSFLIFYILGIEILHIKIIHFFILFFLIGLIYSLIISAILHKKEFLQEIHSFFMQGLFFFSATIIPIYVIPNPFRDILLWLPIVHVQELLKEEYTGVKLEYINIDYPYFFIFLGLFFIIPSLHYKSKRLQDDLNEIN